MIGRTDDGAAALHLLARNACAARSDPERTEQALEQELRLAPDDVDVRLGAYRFFFITTAMKRRWFIASS
jgi:hypothetical protein